MLLSHHEREKITGLFQKKSSETEGQPPSIQRKKLQQKQTQALEERDTRSNRGHDPLHDDAQPNPES